MEEINEFVSVWGVSSKRGVKSHEKTHFFFPVKLELPIITDS